MFSGIVETTGRIKKIENQSENKNFMIASNQLLDDLKIGDSISVNGVCLTVTDCKENNFHVSAVPETLRLTNLGELKEESEVNLERSIKADSRIGGHFVQGHVSGIGQIREIQKEGENALLLKIGIDEPLSKYIIEKGYIALDGMSITAIDVKPDWFSITLIPHTQETTIAKGYKKGTNINIEVDILGKYLEKLVGSYKA